MLTVAAQAASTFYLSCGFLEALMLDMVMVLNLSLLYDHLTVLFTELLIFRVNLKKKSHLHLRM